MKEKSILFLIILIIGSFLFVDIGKNIFDHPNFPFSSFELQEKYATQLEKKLVDLLEPVTGIGNIRASVQASIIHQDITKKQYNPFTLTEQKVNKNGLVLENQSVSVLINQKGKSKISDYKKLIEAAIGYNMERGDQLSIEVLPFAHIPVWTFGLSPIVLARIACGLILCILIGLIWLIKEGRKVSTPYSSIPNPLLWENAENIPSQSFMYALQKKNPEIIATILHQLSAEKTSELIELFSERLRNQVSLHLNYIEKLGVQSYLLQEAEKCVYQILKSTPKTNSPFNLFLNWNNDEIQNLLHYVHKDDFIKALQTTPDNIQQIFKRNIPPTLWKELIEQTQLSHCTEKESLNAQEKIIALTKLLRKEI